MSSFPYESGGFNTGIPLSRFTAAITRAVGSSPELYGAWVTAELSDVRIAGGHCYMELIEKNDDGQTIAKLRANIWQSTFNSLRRKFYEMTQKDISTGLKVLLRGNATHHSLYGLSFNVTDIDPSYTLGDMERIRREILNRLTKEGIINLNKGRELPAAPQRIAIISAEGAAGYGDFMNHLASNREGFVFYPVLFSCAMQGDRVSPTIRDALQFIESTVDLWDCVVIIRGGGATTDLNGFDEYELAKSVATFVLPVIVGIGHERDRTVLDEIAHTRLKTPTAVADFLIDRLRNALEKAMSLGQEVREYSRERIKGEEINISSIEKIIPVLASKKLAEARSMYDKFKETFPLIIKGCLEKEKMRMTNYASNIGSLVTGIISNSGRSLDDLAGKITQFTSYQISTSVRKINSIEELVHVLDPQNTLKRGYSVTRINGHAITRASDLKKGDRIETQLYDGTVESTIT